MGHRIWITALLALAGLNAKADKGHIWPHPVALSEASQRAIILHNRAEEVLILGVELQAQEATEILEFIPFPSEPQVGLAKGKPFEQVQRLIARKGLEFEDPFPAKGSPSTPAPVELRFSAKVGLHDVTVVKLHDAKGLSEWVNEFFKSKGIGTQPDLTRVIPVAEDYLQRGFSYFVFDYVPVQKEMKFIEPLAYRFTTERLYFPLKTSNIVGGQGVVDLVMILPGSYAFESRPEKADHFWRALRNLSPSPGRWLLSSSAKVLSGEVDKVYPEAGKFFKQTRKLYMQVLRFNGEYRFQDDLSLDPGDTVPFAWKIPSEGGGFYLGPGMPGLFFEKFTEDEIKDYCEGNPGSPVCP